VGYRIAHTKRRIFCCRGQSRNRELNGLVTVVMPLPCRPSNKCLKCMHESSWTQSVAWLQGLWISAVKSFKNPCALCSAAAYCCGAVAPRAIAALLGRFLPRLGPLAHRKRPFFLLYSREDRHAGRKRAESRAGWHTIEWDWRDVIPPPPGMARDRRAGQS
jgi:hypothetical protein